MSCKACLHRKPLPEPNLPRVHPAEDMQIATGVFIDREEREVFFVVPELRAELGGDLRPVPRA
jgi:hypothetical protein